MTPKTILITGSTDGIGLLTAKKLAALGHQVILHGRTPSKLTTAQQTVGGAPDGLIADLSILEDVVSMAQKLKEKYSQLDVLINNAGVLKTANTKTTTGLDIRFVVNTIAPYVLTRQLLSIIPENGRIVNLSSAAQARVDSSAIRGHSALDDMNAYSQSKLALTVWSQILAKELSAGPTVVAINPGSLLASKMVKEGFSIPGKDLSIGADILCEAAIGTSFANASGKYFDNDSKQFAAPNIAAADDQHNSAIMEAIKELAGEHL